MIEVEGPDGSIAEFPDGTPPDIIKGAMAKRFAAPPADQRPQPVNWEEAAGRGMGLLRGLRDIPDAGAQLLTRGIEAGAQMLPQGAQDWARGQRENVEGINKTAEEDYRQNWLKGRDPGLDVPRLLGNVAATAPIAAAMPVVGSGFTGALMTGALQGGATGALQPVDPDKPDFWSQKGDQVLTGAGLGAAGAGVMDRIGAFISPKVAPEVKALMDRGVTPTPGQVLGGGFKRAEEGLTSIPVIGDAVKTGQRRAVDQFNVAVLDDALAPIGKKLPSGMEAGRDAISTAGKMISDEYDALLPKLSGTIDNQFMTDLGALNGLARQLPADKAKQFANILDDTLTPQMGSGTFSGEALKKAQSTLSQKAASYMGSGDADQRVMGEGFKAASDALKEMVKRSNPQFADQLSNIDRAYAEYLRAQTAAGRIGAKEGVFSPAQYNSAVREMDKSLRKGQFAKGNALGQEFGSQAEKVLGSTVPDSGSPFRLLNAAALGGGYLVEPTLPIAGLAASSMYLPSTQKLMAQLLANRPAGAEPVGQAIKGLSPLAAALLAGSQ